MGFKRLKRAAKSQTKAPAPSPQLPAVPTSASDGAIMVSAGKYARNIVLGVFEQIGGQDAMALWATENQTDFYTKMFSKTITRETVEDTSKESLEDLLDVIDADCEEVTDAEFEDV